MNRKIIILCSLFLPLLFASCWIYPGYKEYKLIDNIYYFEDYETMKSVIIPLINKSFTAWHWSEEEFDKKYQKYFGNVEIYEKDNIKLSYKRELLAQRKMTKELKGKIKYEYNQLNSALCNMTYDKDKTHSIDNFTYEVYDIYDSYMHQKEMNAGNFLSED